jgi:hypothetical protein
MSEAAEVLTDNQDFLGMSDEAFANMDAAFLTAPGDEDQGDTETTIEQGDGVAAPAADDVTDAGNDDANTADADPENTPDADISTDAVPGDESDNGAGSDDADDDAGDDTDPGKSDDTDSGDSDPVDFKAFYEELTAPFKANGKEMKVDNVQDAIRLMQMGANYNRKMGGMKPHLKMLKTLENAGLLNEEKINFLIDVDKQNPAAIAKLLKDSGVDPMDVDLESGERYKASDHTADEREVALDTVIDEIKDSPTYNQTIKLVSNDWDDSSKQVVADNPQLLKLIDSHMANGVYESISTEVERERVFGRLDGMSDIEAYRQVGDAIEARGGFAHLFKPEQGSQDAPAPTVDAPTKKVDDAKRKDKRRAASPAKAAAPAAQAPDFNPLSMSDEDYMKQFDPRLS